MTTNALYTIERANRPLQQEPYVLWIMGPTSSGKTTVATSFVQRQQAAGIPVLHFDGDEVRGMFGADFGFTPENRLLVVEGLIMLARKAVSSGINVVVSALTAHEEARKLISDKIKNVITVSTQCSIETCAKRDPKGLYQKAMNGEIDTLIGYNTPYIVPAAPALLLDTENQSIQGASSAIADLLTSRGYITG